MTCVLSLWLLHFVCCQLPVTSGSDVFLAKVVSSQRVCDRLCVYTSRCHAYRWDAASRTCHLSTQAASTDTDFTDAKHDNGQCGRRPCAPMETCIPVEAATSYICLLPTSTSVPSSTTTSTTTPKTKTTLTPSATTVITTTATTGAGYRGCYWDGLPRTLPDGHLANSSSMTIDMCRIHCTKNRYSFFGLEAGYECWCGYMIKSDIKKVTEHECNTPCSGDPTKTCGGTWRIAIYQVA